MQMFEARQPKPTPDSQWNDIPGFDYDKAEYVRLDTDAWLRDNGIKETGREDGEQNQPPADATRLDAIHLKIHSWINYRASKCHGDVSRYLTDLARQLTDIENQEGLTILEQRVDQEQGNATIAIKARAKRGNGDLVSTGKAVREGTREYEKFRTRAGLERLPYEGRRGIALFLIIGVIETGLNATLLMDVNPFGLLGAVTQMGLITAVNILVGALAVGFALRCCNLVHRARRTAAWVVVVTVVPVIGAFNLLVGHFRDSMQAIAVRAATDPAVDPFTLLTNDTWQRMTSSPLGFDSFQSSLLVILGLLFFGIASWKGYQWDDPYPGYGRRRRQLNALEDVYLRTWNEARDAVGRVYRDHKARLEDTLHKLQIKNDKWKDLHEIGERLVREYPLHVRQYQYDLDYLIAVYRQENQRARTEPPPRFFSEGLKIDDEVLLAPYFHYPPESNPKDVAKHVHDAIMTIQRTYETALDGFPSLEEVIARSHVHDADEADVVEIIPLTHPIATAGAGDPIAR